MSKRNSKTSAPKASKHHVHVHVAVGAADEAKAVKKAKPKVWNVPVEGNAARTRLDRPGRKLHRADGGPLPISSARPDSSARPVELRDALASGISDRLNSASGAELDMLNRLRSNLQPDEGRRHGGKVSLRKTKA